jgi:hypothetical protein
MRSADNGERKKLNEQQLLFREPGPINAAPHSHLEDIVPDEHNPHSAREAAEALFKPQKQTPESESHDTQTEPAATVDHRAVREPRILPIPQAQPAREPEQPTVSKPRKTRRPSPALNGGQIPKSECGRIRALVTYGMTIVQVAEVYGVAESEIERVVAAKG